MEKPWLNEYPIEMPHEIDQNFYTSIVDMLEKSFAQYPENIAYEWMGVCLSYKELDELSRKFASYLTSERGLKKKDRVGIMLPNILQYPVALLGILRAGMVVVNINPQYTQRELKLNLEDSEASALVLLEDLCAAHEEVLEAAGLGAVIVTTLGETLDIPEGHTDAADSKIGSGLESPVPIPRVRFKDVLAAGGRHRFKSVPLNSEDLAFLQYTGGTTGVPKAAQLIHGNITANLIQLRPWLNGALEPGKECAITILPMYHILALTCICLLSLSFGNKNVLVSDSRDLTGLIEILKKQPISLFVGVNTLFNNLLNIPEFATLDFTKLKITLGAGASIQKAVANRWKQTTGVDISEAYGLTEAAPSCMFPPSDKPEWNGTVGVPLPSTLVALRDDKNNDVGQGEEGEICVKGPQVMLGYWKKPEETKKAFTPDGYLKTGDIAVMNERGYFKLVDRKKDIILVSGFNVYPTEIEGVLALHPGVLECGCIGVPDEKSGEAAKVFIVKSDPALSIEEVRQFCRSNLTGYKVPKHIEFRDSLPKSGVGKILRKELRNL